MYQRETYKIWSGIETDVWETKKNGKISSVVIKDLEHMEGWLERMAGLKGVSEATRNEMEKRFSKRKKQYPSELFLPYHFIKTSPKGAPKNYYILAQKRIEPFILTVQGRARIQCLFNFESQDLSDSVKNTIANLVDALKDSYQRAFQGDKDPESNVALNLEDDNILITKEGQLVYPAMGLLCSDYRGIPDEWMIEAGISRLPYMEVLAGRKPTEFLKESFYEKLLDYCQKQKVPIRLENLTHEKYGDLLIRYLKEFLRDMDKIEKIIEGQEPIDFEALLT